ncbi:probable signal peptidase complex subunit 2 [Anneissia japonica]|uniref:probable signal peptidase complex subunit 2 n=1 Tax=Anneissia japonica TaxID=1529436 RepID=UPI001425922A|nr:probable signal peptidase complex subunit 2 [Anneissia japonica]
MVRDKKSGLKWSIDDKPVTIAKWDGAAVKNSLDDAVRKIMKEKYKYEENFKLVDIRLVICTVSCIFAMFALAWDYFYPFPESCTVLFICVVSYFIMMGILTFYTAYIEKSHFLVTHEKDQAGIDPDNVWVVDSCLKRFDDMYTLEIHFTNGTSKVERESSLTKSVSSWFDESGTLQLELFEKDVQSLHDNISSLEKKEK